MHAFGADFYYHALFWFTILPAHHKTPQKNHVAPEKSHLLFDRIIISKCRAYSFIFIAHTLCTLGIYLILHLVIFCPDLHNPPFILFSAPFMRLDRFLTECTELSRSNAKKALHRGDVTCNGEIVKNAGFKVDDNCVVQLEGQTLNHGGTRYLMVNKPLDCICSNISEAGYPSVLNWIDLPKADSLMIAGRLDADTTGLVLVTSDGQWSHKITSPRKECGKRYLVTLLENLPSSAVEQLEQGILLKSETEPTKPAVVEVLSDKEVRITISEGKYHQVKRMFAAVSNKVVSLHREQIGEIELDADLEPGEWRELTPTEIASV